MAGRSKSWYLTVCDKQTHKNVYTRMFLDVKALRDYTESEQYKERFPDDKFYWIKETY